MILRLNRISHSKHGTFGVMTVNDEEPMYTLEETEKQIPVGTYKVELTYSPHFKRSLPLLSVPHRAGIRIHAGNWPRDSSGCILVGLDRGDNMITHSEEALIPLVLELQLALSQGDSVVIVVSDVP